MITRISNHVRGLLNSRRAPPYWSYRTSMVGIEMDADKSTRFLNEIVIPYLPEFRHLFSDFGYGSRDFHLEKVKGFYLINSSFMAVDAHVYYAIIRSFKPSRIVEIGGGNSSLLALEALERNSCGSLTVVDPNPSPMLLDRPISVIASPIEQTDLSLFTSLKVNDIVFIDSSHMMTTGGDIAWEYCEILPRLAPGVLVHVHDVHLPAPYPKVYYNHKLYYNEQYMLQALLCLNEHFEILWPGAYMYELDAPNLRRVFFPEIMEMQKEYPLAVPTSFWMRVREMSDCPGKPCEGCASEGVC